MTILKNAWSKTPSVAKWLVVLVAVAGAGWLAGRYAKPDKIVTNIEVKVVEVVKWQTVTEYQTNEVVKWRNQEVLAQTADKTNTVIALEHYLSDIRLRIYQNIQPSERPAACWRPAEPQRPPQIGPRRRNFASAP